MPNGQGRTENYRLILDIILTLAKALCYYCCDTTTGSVVSADAVDEDAAAADAAVQRGSLRNLSRQ